ncbi:MAG: sigma-70 family RNA polymerase sigma factor [Saprospiraceae bacterium]|nr:sigma-70 family RNA polymerase sigma factor [Saprospiraceae bacterium]
MEKPTAIKDRNNAVEAWVLTYGDSLFRRAFFLTGQRELAEELLQDTFLAALQAFDRFQGNSTPKSWLMAIMNHKAADLFRKKFRMPVLSDSDFFRPSGQWDKSHIPTQEWAESTADLLNDDDFQTTLQQCLNNLPDHWRAAFLMKFLEGKKGSAICQDLNIASTNYWQILHRAKLQLRECLERNWFKI